MNIIEFLLTLPATLKNFSENLMEILTMKITTTFGEISLIGIIGGGILVVIMVAEIIKWFLD